MQKIQKVVRLGNLGVAVALGSLFIASASANIITGGEANFSGTSTVGSTTIKFFGPPVGTGPNTLNVEQPNTVSFSGFATGTIKDVTGPLPINQFVTFLTPTPIFFDLLSFGPPVGTAAGPFSLTQVNGSVAISLTVIGRSYTNTSLTGSTPTIGVFTTQKPGTIADILAAAGSPSGVTASYSATFTAANSPVPEPASMFMLGSGLIAVGLWGRKKFFGQRMV